MSSRSLSLWVQTAIKMQQGNECVCVFHIQHGAALSPQYIPSLIAPFLKMKLAQFDLRQQRNRWPLPKTRLTKNQRQHIEGCKLCLADHPEYHKYHRTYKVNLKWWDWIKPIRILFPKDSSLDEEVREILKAY